MPNMSYCRFENTLGDLKDCYENMDDEKLNEYEVKARKKLIGICVDIALDYGSEIDREVEEV